MTKTAEDEVEIIRASHAAVDVSESNESSALFKQDFECPDGHVITAPDSLANNPLLAMTLLKGVALSKDMENLPGGRAPNMVELCLFIAKAYLTSFL